MLYLINAKCRREIGRWQSGEEGRLREGDADRRRAGGAEGRRGGEANRQGDERREARWKDEDTETERRRDGKMTRSEVER